MIWFIILGLGFAWMLLPKNDHEYPILNSDGRRIVKRMTYDEGMAELREKHKE